MYIIIAQGVGGDYKETFGGKKESLLVTPQTNGDK